MEENMTTFQDDGFSFIKFVDLLKRSAKRILIYTIIAVLLGGAVGAVIAVATKGVVEYKGIMEFSYKGIDDGLDPKGNVLETGRIKSNIVINNALSEMGFNAEKTASLAIILVDDIMVEGYVSDTMRMTLLTDKTAYYFPSRYIITVKRNKDTGFSKSQYIDFVNKFMAAYVEYFSEYYDFGKLVTLVVNENTVSTSSDYISALRSYENEVASLQTEIDSLPSAYNLIRNKLQARLDILLSQVNDLSSYILKNNVQKVGAAIGLYDYLKMEEANFLEQQKMYDEKAQSLEQVIKEYKVIYEQISNLNNTLSVTVADVTKYNELVSEYQAARTQEIIYKKKIAEVESAKKLNKPTEDYVVGVATPAQRQAAEAKFNVLLDSLNAEIDAINTELTNFSRLNVLNNGVKIAMSAVKYSNVSYVGAIVAFVIIVVAGIAAAIIVTAVKTKKSLIQSYEGKKIGA